MKRVSTASGGARSLTGGNRVRNGRQQLEIEPPLVEAGRLRAPRGTPRSPAARPPEHVLDDPDARVVPERDVDVLARHEVDGHGRAGRAVNSDAERSFRPARSARTRTASPAAGDPRAAEEAPRPLPRSDPRPPRGRRARRRASRRATSSGSGRSSPSRRRAAPSRGRRARRGPGAPRRTAHRRARGRPPGAPRRAAARAGGRRTAERRAACRAGTRTSRCSSAGRTCSRCTRRSGRRHRLRPCSCLVRDQASGRRSPRGVSRPSRNVSSITNSDADDHAAEALDELDLRLCRATGREHVVEHDHARARGTASRCTSRLSVPYSSA